MTVIRADRLEEFWNRHPDAERALLAWLQAVEAVDWKKPTDVLQTFGSADVAISVRSGRKVAIFDIRGNKYRLAAAIDYRSGTVNVLKVMTHREYDRNRWKESL